AEAVHELNAGAPQRLRIERRLNGNEGVRANVFSELELRAAQEAADVRLHIRGGYREHVRAEGPRRFAGELVGCDTECHTCQLLARERRARSHDVVSSAPAGQSGAFELYQR